MKIDPTQMVVVHAGRNAKNAESGAEESEQEGAAAPRSDDEPTPIASVLDEVGGNEEGADTKGQEPDASDAQDDEPGAESDGDGQSGVLDLLGSVFEPADDPRQGSADDQRGGRSSVDPQPGAAAPDERREEPPRAAPGSSGELDVASVLTPDERERFSVSLPVIQKVATAVADRRAAALSARLDRVEQQLAAAMQQASQAAGFVRTTGKAQFEAALRARVPDIGEIAGSKEFRSWLKTRVPGFGHTWGDGLQDAIDRLDAERAATIIEEFKARNGASRRKRAPAGAEAPAGQSTSSKPPAGGASSGEVTMEVLDRIAKEGLTRFTRGLIPNAVNMKITEVVDQFRRRLYAGERIKLSELKAALESIDKARGG